MSEEKFVYKEGDVIEFVGQLKFRLYPKTIPRDGDFQVIACSVEKDMGDIPIKLNNHGNIVIGSANFPMNYNYHEFSKLSQTDRERYDKEVEGVSFHIKAIIGEVGGQYGI